MIVTLKKTEKIDVEMSDLMTECIERLDLMQQRATRNRYTHNYENLQDLVQESLEYLFDIELYYYDNSDEIINTTANNLLKWCLEYDYIEEHNRLKEMR